MSSFLGQINSALMVEKDDQRIAFQGIQQDVELSDFGPIVADYRTEWWPGGSSFYGDQANDISMFPQVSTCEGISWSFIEKEGGTTSFFGVTGITRDVFGSPLGGCKVKLFLTSTDQLVSQTTSDPLGNYTAVTPFYPSPHYIVIYKAGTPDVAGTTVNTIIAR